MERFVATYHLLLDYFALADNGRVGVVAPLQVPSVDDEGKAGDAAQASAGGAAGGKDKAAPAAKGGGKPGAAAKGASKAAVAEPEPAAAEQASPLDASIAVASRHCSAGGDLVAAAVRGVATIRSWQEQQRSRLWDAELAAIAAEREARDAAAAAAAAGAAGKGAKPAAGKAAPAKAAAGKAPAGGKAGAKGKAGEPADAAPAVPDGATVFVNESVLAVVEHEARALEGRLQYLLRRCRSDCEHVSTLADAMLTSLAALASDTAAAEGAAVEALCAHARSAVEAATTLPARLQLEVRLCSPRERCSVLRCGVCGVGWCGCVRALHFTSRQQRCCSGTDCHRVSACVVCVVCAGSVPHRRREHACSGPARAGAGPRC
jgi:hypothetical protein